MRKPTRVGQQCLIDAADAVAFHIGPAFHFAVVAWIPGCPADEGALCFIIHPNGQHEFARAVATAVESLPMAETVA